MRILKLPWLSHRECYALDVNKSGTKLASGGLDGKVKVWDLQSIIKYQEKPVDGLADGNSEFQNLSRRMDEPSGLLERPLASMNRHNGVVTSVKFSPDGRFLASGSDDKIVLIWEKDDESAPRPKQFGEAEADVEHWTVRKRLVAHDNDVQDICWSPDGSLLITVGLDRSIIIWNGATFERIKRYDIHQSMVKGVVFDPANKFFATASDDRTVRIFRYYRKFNDLSSGNYEFQMEQIIMEPFQKSPLTSYFRRMSWSPDGQHVAVPNATNGPVTSVVIINRGNWATDVSLIGHEAPCEVCSFSPRLYRLSSKNPDAHTTILASGGQDRTLAIWSTALTKPLVVAHDIVQRSITDITWAPDGHALFLSSLDGSITCVVFEENELGEPVSGDAIGSQLERYGGDRDSTIMVESVDQLQLETISKTSKTSAREKLPTRTPNLSAQASATPSFPSFSSTLQPFVPTLQSFSPKMSPLSSSNTSSPKRAKKVLQTAVVMKGGKKRVAPTLISTYSGGTTTSSRMSNSSTVTATAAASSSKTFKVSSKVSQTTYALPKLGLQSAVHGLRLASDTPAKGTGEEADADNDNEDMGFDDPNSNQLQTLTAAGIRVKMKKFRKQLMNRKYPTPFKKISDLPEVLFSNQAIMNGEFAKLVQTDKVNVTDAELINTSSLDSIDESLYFRVIVNAIEHKTSAKGGEISLENISDAVKTPARSVIEVRNGPSWPDDEEILNTDPIQRTDFQDPTQVIVTNNENQDSRSYILYFPFKIQHAIPVLLDDELVYYVLISFEGVTQIIRADSGTFFFPSFELGSNVIASKQKGQFLMVLTSLGQIFCWRFPKVRTANPRLEKVLSRVTVAPVLNTEVFISQDSEASKDVKDTKAQPVIALDNISALDIDERDGSPVLVIERTGCVYTYSIDLMIWTKSLDPWYLLAYERGEVSRLPSLNKKHALLASVLSSKFEKIQRGEAESYRFDDKNHELKVCMRTRFEELVGL
ncbi:hypothetical protein JCM33374_g3745 [Metschnikowia sp. JCM 33374]|nr:hypothetical protein JCM33374_g3745 [Metschnikowia sp. JCM 33374]